MTTPEKLKARQLQIIEAEERTRKWLRLEGLAVGLLMIVVAGDNFLDEREDARQDRCVAQQITDLTSALNTRSASTGRLNQATGDVIDSFVVAGAKSRPGLSDAEREKNNAPILEALQRYAKVQAEVKRDRQDSPFPPFPTGTCNSE